ncbi:MAG: hypothetical protein ACO1Q7_12285 [Gemmatimonas sp.]
MSLSTRERFIFSRRLLAAVCAGSLAFNIGCYSYQPVQSQPPAIASKVSIRLNDLGRETLASRVGPLMDRVEGRLLSNDSTSVRLSVSRVVNLRGDASNWIGEEVTVPKAAILGYEPRPFSKPRTIALIGAVVGVLALVALSISIAVSGQVPSEDPPGPVEPS